VASGEQTPILTLTVNPALDLATGVDRLVPRIKLRCDAPQDDAGGGGVNVSRAIHALGGQSRALVALGGAMGEKHFHLMRAEGLSVERLPLVGETRFSVLLEDRASGEYYRLVMPGPTVDKDEGKRLFASIAAAIAGGALVVGSGSLLPGLTPDFYGRVAAAARVRGAKMIVDTHGDAMKAAINYRPWLIRLNHIEAADLTGRDDGADLNSARLVAQGAAEIAVVADGENGSVVAFEGGQFRVRPVKVAVKGMVGAGDSYVAALTLALARGQDLETANRWGVAAAASAVSAEGTGLCTREGTEALFRALPPTHWISKA
jgi:6-phosphofructokinase 2